MHSNSLIKHLTPLEDDAGIRLVNFPMYAARRFTQIDFCFEVFKQLKGYVLSYLTGAT